MKQQRGGRSRSESCVWLSACIDASMNYAFSKKGIVVYSLGGQRGSEAKGNRRGSSMKQQCAYRVGVVLEPSTTFSPLCLPIRFFFTAIPPGNYSYVTILPLLSPSTTCISRYPTLPDVDRSPSLFRVRGDTQRC